ncbi:Probable 28S ribosomal protein S23, mitochondrial [Anthophora quadrimaculata]
MANSRTERIGTVFSRVTALVKGGALQKENLPVWYNVYKTFPPKYEPSFDRPLSKKHIQQIFYTEDYLRAQFYKDVSIQAINLKSKSVTPTQIFINIYENLLKDDLNEDEAYNKALELLSKSLDKPLNSSTTEQKM